MEFTKAGTEFKDLPNPVADLGSAHGSIPQIQSWSCCQALGSHCKICKIRQEGLFYF